MLQHDIVSGMVIKENIHFAEPVLKVISQINVVEPDVLQIVVKLTVINEPLSALLSYSPDAKPLFEGAVAAMNAAEKENG